MDIQQALKLSGFSRCVFQAERWDVCHRCQRAFQSGESMYYERIGYGYRERDVCCASCVILIAEEFSLTDIAPLKATIVDLSRVIEALWLKRKSLLSGCPGPGHDPNLIIYMDYDFYYQCRSEKLEKPVAIADQFQRDGTLMGYPVWAVPKRFENGGYARHPKFMIVNLGTGDNYSYLSMRHIHEEPVDE